MSSRSLRSPRAAVAFAAFVSVGLTGCDTLTGTDDLECSGGQQIAVGESVNGSLQPGDDLDVDGAFLDRYALAVEDDGEVTITLTSVDFDAWLWLLDEDESVLDSDDDSAGDFNARITMSLDRGCYLVDATSFEEGETGDYELVID